MTTIADLEQSFQNALEAMRNSPINQEVVPIRELLVPDGLSPVVELVNEQGRRKRSNAAAWNWNPQSDKIVISFRPCDSLSGRTDTPKPGSDLAFHPSQANAAPPMQAEAKKPADLVAEPQALENAANSVDPESIIECCQALASAERSNRQFIALKWFRDDFLATVDFAWAKSPQTRQRVLSRAIEMGRIEAKKIPNPKAPQFPTTTISLNRSVPTPGVPPRFQPVAIRGESASATLLRDRGAF